MEVNNNKLMQPEWVGFEFKIMITKKTNEILILAHTEFDKHMSTCCVHGYNIDAMWNNIMSNPYFN